MVAPYGSGGYSGGRPKPKSQITILGNFASSAPKAGPHFPIFPPPPSPPKPSTAMSLPPPPKRAKKGATSADDDDVVDVTSAVLQDKADKAVQEALTCVICWLPMLGKIVQCRNGHVVCGDCADKIETDSEAPKCPYCRDEAAFIRCRTLEKLAPVWLFSCPKSNCKWSGTGAELRAHSCQRDVARSAEAPRIIQVLINVEM